jgi:glucose-1-phosphate adenylyltransferase
VVKYSVIMNDTVIGRESVIDYSILDKEIIVEAGSHVGTGNDFQPNREEPAILNTGLTVVGKGAKIPEGVKIGRNCAIACNVTEKDFRSSIVQSGETIRKKQRPARKE